MVQAGRRVAGHERQLVEAGKESKRTDPLNATLATTAPAGLIRQCLHNCPTAMPVTIPLVRRSLSSATGRCTTSGYKRVSRRTIFSLPDLSSLSPFSGSGGDSQNPQTYHERKILPYVIRCLEHAGLADALLRYKPSDLYNIVTNVNSYPQFLPFCTNARVVATSRVSNRPGSPERINMQAEMTVGFMSFKESYMSDVTCVPNQSVEVSHINVTV